MRPVDLSVRASSWNGIVGGAAMSEKADSRRLARRNANKGAMLQKRAADLRAKALAPVIRDIRAAGHTTLRSICGELNRIAVPTARGGRWHVASVHRLLTRLR